MIYLKVVISDWAGFGSIFTLRLVFFFYSKTMQVSNSGHVRAEDPTGITQMFVQNMNPRPNQSLICFSRQRSRWTC